MSPMRTARLAVLMLGTFGVLALPSCPSFPEPTDYCQKPDDCPPAPEGSMRFCAKNVCKPLQCPQKCAFGSVVLCAVAPECRLDCPCPPDFCFDFGPGEAPTEVPAKRCMNIPQERDAGTCSPAPEPCIGACCAGAVCEGPGPTCCLVPGQPCGIGTNTFCCHPTTVEQCNAAGCN